MTKTVIGHIDTVDLKVIDNILQTGGTATPAANTPGIDTDHPAQVSGYMVTVSVEFTRPADGNAYQAGDVVSNNAGATTPMNFQNFMRVAGGTGYIVKARLSTNKKSLTPRIRVHLYNDISGTFAADNAQNIEKYADKDKRLGYFDLPAMTTAPDATNSDMSRSFDLTLRIAVTAKAGSRSIYAVLETLDAFTPDSGQKFNLTLVGDLN